MNTAAQSVFIAPPPARRGLISGAILAVAAALFTAAPAAAQTAGTLTIAAVGNNGDRDATARGLQVDEGDTVTITITAHGRTAGTIGVNAPPTGDAAYSGSAISPADVHNGRDVSNEHIVGNIGSGTTDTVDLSITADNMAEGDESITFTLDVASIVAIGATPASWTVGTPGSVTFTIRRNDADNDYAPTPPDNPAARGERLDAPVAAVARGIGQLAAEAVMRRLHTAATANQFHLGRASTAEELLRRSSFNLAGGDGGRGFNFWGSGGFVSAEGDHDGVDYDGDTSAFTLGIDTGWKNGLIGVAVSRSDGDTDFTVTADGMESTLETTVTSVHPYLTRQFNKSQIYLTAGHGSGDAELKEPDTVIKTDITVTTAAFGLTRAHDAQLSGGVSALYTRAKLDAAQSAGRTLPATTADSLRVAASGQARWTRGAWSPFADFTVRHDSGDGDTGIAGDLGGGIEFRAPAIHIRLAAATTIAADSAEEHRATLVIRKSTGDFALGLNLAADDTGLDTARLLHGEWKF